MSILGIDLGKKYVGIAIAEGSLAQALTTLHRHELLERLDVLCKKHQVEKVVIGIPESKPDHQAKQLAGEIESKLGIEVVYFDETLSSRHAMNSLVMSATSRKKRKIREHAVAAAIFLDEFLASGRSV